MKPNAFFLFVPLLVLAVSCGNRPDEGSGKTTPETEIETMFDPLEGDIRLINLDPGHFHASLVQKTMYEGVDPKVHVYAPDGPELEDYLNRIRDYNHRSENPTNWELEVYRGPDFLEKMLEEKAGNVMVVSGNNGRKTEVILETVRNGIHVLADKPMVITPGEFSMLEEAFRVAEEQGVLLYDIMTERYEITTLLQRELSMIPGVFGQLQKGTPDEPAITKESVHHFFKYVSGKPLVRPPWFFDVTQQGEGIVDVTTHLVDLIQWEAFPGMVLEKSDVEMLAARRWTTDLTPEEFARVTGLERYPAYLEKDLDGEILKVYCNGSMDYTLKGVHAHVSVIWNYQAPEGTGDTHYSVMRGSRCNLEIRQGEAESYRPELYVAWTGMEFRDDFISNLEQAVSGPLSEKYPGIGLSTANDSIWKVEIPDRLRVGHEAHFGQVTEKYLGFLREGTLPEWEIPNMIVKYHTTTGALEKARDSSAE